MQGSGVLTMAMIFKVQIFMEPNSIKVSGRVCSFLARKVNFPLIYLLNFNQGKLGFLSLIMMSDFIPTSCHKTIQGDCLTLIKRSQNRSNHSLPSLVHYHWFLRRNFN